MSEQFPLHQNRHTIGYIYTIIITITATTSTTIDTVLSSAKNKKMNSKEKMNNLHHPYEGRHVPQNWSNSWLEYSWLLYQRIENEKTRQQRIDFDQHHHLKQILMKLEIVLFALAFFSVASILI